jgi:hypothetical protein
MDGRGARDPAVILPTGMVSRSQRPFHPHQLFDFFSTFENEQHFTPVLRVFAGANVDWSSRLT